MKQPRMESLRRSQTEYHRSHPWCLSAGGLFIPHSYADKTPESLSWWDDVGFILNGRRIIVWWQHPRYVYREAIHAQAWSEVGTGPQGSWLTEGATKNYRKVGRSRKKLVGYTLGSPSEEQTAHYKRLNAATTELENQGIEFEVKPSWKWKRLWWAMGVSLVAPLEVRNEDELAAVARLAKRLVKQQTTLVGEFPEYCYRRENWLQELKGIQR